jgi:molybdenum cofactor cytidylyltransferase
MARGSPAIVLAAGASKRLGQPKAMVPIGGTTLVGLAVQRLREAGCTPIVVVTRRSLHFEITIEALGAVVVVNNQPEDGRTGSIQRGLLSLMGDKGRTPRKVIVAPVDRPGWKKEHVRALMEQETTSTLCSQGRKGHPLMLVGEDIERVLASPPETPLRDQIRPRLVEVDAPHMGLNIDTEADLLALKEAEPALLD